MCAGCCFELQVHAVVLCVHALHTAALVPDWEVMGSKCHAAAVCVMPRVVQQQEAGAHPLAGCPVQHSHVAMRHGMWVHAGGLAGCHDRGPQPLIESGTAAICHILLPVSETVAADAVAAGLIRAGAQQLSGSSEPRERCRVKVCAQAPHLLHRVVGVPSAAVAGFLQLAGCGVAAVASRRRLFDYRHFALHIGRSTSGTACSGKQAARCASSSIHAAYEPYRGAVGRVAIERNHSPLSNHIPMRADSERLQRRRRSWRYQKPLIGAPIAFVWVNAVCRTPGMVLMPRLRV
jgi:hypothetical protein